MSYESEKQELLKWAIEQSTLVMEERRRRPLQGKDGNPDLRARDKQIDAEFKRRLKELREKYNK